MVNVTGFSLDEYLTLVDATGRLVRSGKRGAIPPHLPPLLDRLKIDVGGWVEALTTAQRHFGSTVGSRLSRAAEAMRRGAHRVVGSFDVYG